MASDFITSNQYDNCPCYKNKKSVWVTIWAVALIFISGRSSAISIAQKGIIIFHLLGKDLLFCQPRVQLCHVLFTKLSGTYNR